MVVKFNETTVIIDVFLILVTWSTYGFRFRVTVVTRLNLKKLVYFYNTLSIVVSTRYRYSRDKRHICFQGELLSSQLAH